MGWGNRGSRGPVRPARGRRRGALLGVSPGSSAALLVLLLGALVVFGALQLASAGNGPETPCETASSVANEPSTCEPACDEGTPTAVSDGKDGGWWCEPPCDGWWKPCEPCDKGKETCEPSCEKDKDWCEPVCDKGKDWCEPCDKGKEGCETRLVVRKVVVNDDGGTAVASDFSFSVDGGPAVPFEADGENVVTVGPGVHTVTETPASGYTTTLANCTNVHVHEGGTTTCTITNDDVPAPPPPLGVELTKTPSPASLPAPGGDFQFTLVVHNTSAVAVTITSLTDSVEGGPDAVLVGACAALVGTQLAADDGVAGSGPDQASCTFTRTFTGAAGDTQDDLAKVAVEDDAKRTATAQAPASVSLTGTTPPPQPPTVAPSVIDLAVDKTGPAAVVVDGAPAVVTWSVTFTNNGPATATNVTALDAAGGIGGVVFTTVKTQPSPGTCTVALDGKSISCLLGTMGPGEVRTAEFTGTVDGTVDVLTNTVDVVGSETESNTANNTDAVTTTVTRPLLPPTVKPSKPAKPSKPRAKPPVKKPAKPTKPARKPGKPAQVCNTLTVSKQTLRASGKAQSIVASVRKGKRAVKGARVLVTGPGIKVTAITGASGTARIRLRPTRTGILKLEIRNKLACNTQRIGVVAVFEPPVTG